VDTNSGFVLDLIVVVFVGGLVELPVLLPGLVVGLIVVGFVVGLVELPVMLPGFVVGFVVGLLELPVLLTGFVVGLIVVGFVVGLVELPVLLPTTCLLQTSLAVAPWLPPCLQSPLPDLKQFCPSVMLFSGSFS